MENRIVKLTEDNNGMLHCACGAEILCDKETGDMPEKCPKCGATLDYSAYVSGATPWVCTDPDCVQYRRPDFGCRGDCVRTRTGQPVRR